MLDFILSVTATTLEGIGIFVLTLNLFRFRVKDYILAIAIANITVSTANFLMKKYEFYYDLSLLVNIIILILALLFFVKVSLFESLLMSIIGILSCLLIQAFVVIGFSTYDGLSLTQIRYSDNQYLIQVISFVLFLITSRLLNKNNLWFTFVPFRQFWRIKLNTLNILTLILLVLAVIAMGHIIEINNIIIGTLLVVMFLVLFLYLAIKKEKTS